MTRSSPLRLAALSATAAVLLGGAAHAAPKVLLCYADSMAVASSVKSALDATGAFQSVTLADCSTATPALATLKMYEAVLAWDNFSFKDRKALGDVLADYVDAGGGVVLSMFALFGNFELQGRWRDDGYNCIAPDAGQRMDVLAGQPREPNSPLVQGVKSLSSQNASRGKLAAGATSVWDWVGGVPAVARCTVKGRARVDLGFYPNPQNYTGDGVALLKNALVAVAVGFNPLRGAPSPVDFPDTGTGAISAPVTVTFTNTAMAARTVTALEVSGAAAGDFTLSGRPALPLTLQPNDTFTVDVRFSPTAQGARAAVLSAVVTGEMSNAEVQLEGAGIPAKLSVTPSPVDFGGTTLNQAVETTVTVANDGAGRIAISSIAAAAPFSIVSLPALPVVISSGGSFDLKLAFRPTQHGLEQGSLTFGSNDPNAPTFVVPMSGYSGPQAIGADATAVSFGRVNLGASSTRQTVSVRNEGYSTLRVTSIALAGANPGDFTLDAAGLPGTIPPLASVDVGVVFTPTALGGRGADLVVGSDDATEPTMTVKLLGTGTQLEATIEPGMLALGTVRVGEAGTPGEVTITTTGDGTLRVADVAIEGADASSFKRGAGPPAPFAVPGGMEQKLGFACSPTRNGALAATARIVTDVKTVTVALTCTGVSPRMVVAPNLVEFGPVRVGQASAMVPFSVENQGTADLTVESIDFIGPEQVDFESPDWPMVLPVVVAPGGRLEFNLLFRPSAGGPATSDLVLATDDPLLPVARVPLQGSGTEASFTVKPPILDFGAVLLGATAGPLEATIQNTGDTVLEMVTVAPAGTGSGAFSIDDRGPFTIMPGESRLVRVGYAPVVAGNSRANLQVTARNVSMVTVALTGTATSPMVDVTLPGGLAELSFGEVRVGELSPSQTVTIANPGSQPLSLASITAEDPAFVLDLAATALAIPPGGSTSFGVAFRPATASVVRSTVSLRLPNATGALYALTVAGTGIDAPPEDAGGGCSVARRAPNRSAPPVFVLVPIALLALAVRRRRGH